MNIHPMSAKIEDLTQNAIPTILEMCDACCIVMKFLASYYSENSWNKFGKLKTILIMCGWIKMNFSLMYLIK